MDGWDPFGFIYNLVLYGFFGKLKGLPDFELEPFTKRTNQLISVKSLCPVNCDCADSIKSFMRFTSSCTTGPKGSLDGSGPARMFEFDSLC